MRSERRGEWTGARTGRGRGGVSLVSGGRGGGCAAAEATALQEEAGIAMLRRARLD